MTAPSAAAEEEEEEEAAAAPAASPRRRWVEPVALSLFSLSLGGGQQVTVFGQPLHFSLQKTDSEREKQINREEGKSQRESQRENQRERGRENRMDRRRGRGREREREREREGDIIQSITHGPNTTPHNERMQQYSFISPLSITTDCRVLQARRTSVRHLFSHSSPARSSLFFSLSLNPSSPCMILSHPPPSPPSLQLPPCPSPCSIHIT